MSQSKHQAIAEKVKTVLAALANANVFEGRDVSLPAGQASQINIYLDDSTPSAVVIMDEPIDWTTQVNVQIKARRTSADPAERVSDAIWVDAWALVMADQSLGGLVQLLDPALVTRDRDEADTDVHCISWQFNVTHRTANNVLT